MMNDVSREGHLVFVVLVFYVLTWHQFSCFSNCSILRIAFDFWIQGRSFRWKLLFRLEKKNAFVNEIIREIWFLCFFLPSMCADDKIVVLFKLSTRVYGLRDWDEMLGLSWSHQGRSKIVRLPTVTHRASFDE